MKRKQILGLLTAAGAVWMSGCNGNPQQMDSTAGSSRTPAPPRQLMALERPWIPDLPVPMGFKIDESRSRHFSGGAARYVDHLYKGGADKFDVARFYLQQMPIQRWVLVTEMFVQGDVSMDFKKESESCRVVVSDGGLWHSTYVKVTLWTTGRIESREGSKKR